MSRSLRSVIIVLLLVLGGYNICFSQAKEPISFEGILRLPDFGLSSQQIADQITQSGLSFEVTSAQIDSLRKLGFAQSVIDAVRQFYRMGILKITTLPGEVAISVDNVSSGASDRGGIWQGELPRGIHTIRLEKKGYVSRDTSITIVKDQTSNLRISLAAGAVAGPSNFYGRYGASLAYGISIMSPEFKDEGKWKSGNNIILSLKGNLKPYLFVDIDFNMAGFSDFDSAGGNNFGSLDALNFSIIPGLYKEFNQNVRGYLGIGLEINSSKIENGKFVSDGVAYIPDEKGSKTLFALMTKIGADALVKKNIFLFAEYRGYSVLGKYSMSFIALGAGAYFR